MNCPTVKVKCDNDQGFYIINESDFNKENHELFTGKPKKETIIKEGTKAWYALKLTDLNVEFKVTQSAKELKELFESSEK